MLKHWKPVFGITLVLVIAILVFDGFKLDAQTDKTNKEKPTVIMGNKPPTDDERAYSKEFKKLYPGDEGKIPQLVEKAKKRNTTDEIGFSYGVPSIPVFGNKKVLSDEERLLDLSCKSSAIVVGTVKSATAHVTEDKSFIYTQYDLEISEILKNNDLKLLRNNDVIRVVRPGGLIKLDDQLVRVDEKSYPPLMELEKYVVFLQYILVTDGYIPTRVEGTFILSDGKIRQWREKHPTEFSKDIPQEFFTFIRSNLSAICTN